MDNDMMEELASYVDPMLNISRTMYSKMDDDYWKDMANCFYRAVRAFEDKAFTRSEAIELCIAFMNNVGKK